MEIKFRQGDQLVYRLNPTRKWVRDSLGDWWNPGQGHGPISDLTAQNCSEMWSDEWMIVHRGKENAVLYIIRKDWISA